MTQINWCKVSMYGIQKVILCEIKTHKQHFDVLKYTVGMWILVKKVPAP